MATKWTQETILIKLKELHPTLDFSQLIYTSVNNKSIIICPIHGPREMKVMNLLRGNSCKLCRPQSQKRSYDQVISKFKEVHGERYSYSKFEYTDQYQEIDIICKEHGPFSQQILHHSNGSGCEKCHDRTFNRKDLDSHILMIPLSISKYFEYKDIFYKDGESYLRLYCNRCNKEHEQITYRCKNNDTCPNCNGSYLESKGIIEIKEYLRNNNIIFEKEKTFKNCINPVSGYKLRFDIYIEHLDCCIEFDGIQHYKETKFFGGMDRLEQSKYRDNLKTKYCEENNIKLIRIKYNKVREIKKILDKELLKK